MRNKTRGKILECVAWSVISGGLLFWLLDPLFAAVLFAVVLYLIIQVGRETIQAQDKDNNLLKDGVDLKNFIPAYFYIGNIRGDYPNYTLFRVPAGTDPFVFLIKDKELHLYKCQKHLYPDAGNCDEHNVSQWLLGDVILKIPAEKIASVELHRIVLSERALKKMRSKNFWQWYRHASHPVLQFANLRDIQCFTVLTLVIQQQAAPAYISFGIPEEIPGIVSLPWTRLTPEWLQNLEGLLELSAEVHEYAKEENDKEENSQDLQHAKIMAAQIKQFAPHVKVKIITK
jgi:hypothetical protein